MADGDAGQILMLFLVDCLEDFLKKYFPKRTMKGKARSETSEVARTSATCRVSPWRVMDPHGIPRV